jgi:hypothetical protein
LRSCCRCATCSCSAWCRSCGPGDTAPCRSTFSARPRRPRCCTRSPAAARRRHRRRRGPVRRVRLGVRDLGTALYWWAGLLYAWQVRILMVRTAPLSRTPCRVRRVSDGATEPRQRQPARATFVALLSDTALDPDYFAARHRRAGSTGAPAKGPGSVASGAPGAPSVFS